MTDAICLTLRVYPDDRGSVREAFRESWFGLPPIVQMVHSESKPDVMRAMHSHKLQFDIWHFTKGEAFVQLYYPDEDAVVTGWYGPGDTLIIPPGVAHGFYTASGCTLIYLLTREYDGTDEYEFDAYDPSYPGKDAWPVGPDEAIRSKRDRQAQSFAAYMAGLEGEPSA